MLLHTRVVYCQMYLRNSSLVNKLFIEILIESIIKIAFWKSKCQFGKSPSIFIKTYFHPIRTIGISTIDCKI